MDLLLCLGLLLGAAHLIGLLFARLRQPRVVGEIVGGLLVGVSGLASLWPGLALPPAPAWEGVVARACEEAGLLLLMFISGAGMRGLIAPGEGRAVAWLATSGTALPFAAAVAVAARLPLEALRGPAESPAALVLVLGVAAAVTSIPVISRIFFDLDLLHTRFARLVLGVAVVEDVALWAVLALATALAGAAALPPSPGAAALPPSAGAAAHLLSHLLSTLVFLLVGLLAARPLQRLERWARNPLPSRLPVVWLALVGLLYWGAAWLAGVKPVFAAFFAGLAVEGQGASIAAALGALRRICLAVPVPLYFALVGYHLDLGASFSWPIVLALLLGASAVKLAAVGLGARMAGFRGWDALNLAVATNARGGPGIVLASVAREAGIVNERGYTALVLLALVTSQAAGAWIERVVRSGRPLLCAGSGEGQPLARER